MLTKIVELCSREICQSEGDAQEKLVSLGQLMTASQKSCSELYECSSQGKMGFYNIKGVQEQREKGAQYFKQTLSTSVRA